MRCLARIAGATVLVLVVAGFVFAGQIYRWTDAQGTSHFTDDLTQVPPAQRDKAEILDLPDGPAPRPRPSEAEEDAGTSSGEESRSDLEEMVVDPLAACQGAVRGEAMALKKQMDRDTKRLAEINREIHRTAVSRVKNDLQRERAALKDRLEQARARLEGDLAARARECQMEPDW